MLFRDEIAVRFGSALNFTAWGCGEHVATLCFTGVWPDHGGCFVAPAGLTEHEADRLASALDSALERRRGES